MSKLLVALLLASQLFVMLNPLLHRWNKEVAAQVLIIAVLCSLIWKRNKPIALFIAWSMFMMIMSKAYIKNEDNHLYIINYFAFFNMINITLYGFFYYVLHEFKLNRELIYKTFCFIAIANATYVLIQFVGLDQFFARRGLPIGSNDTVGFWDNRDLCAWAIAVCSPYFLAFNKLRYRVGYAVCFLAVVLLQSTTAIVAYALGGIFCLFFKNKKAGVVALLTFGLIIGFLYMCRTPTLDYYLRAQDDRFKVWGTAIDKWKHDEKTITGYGPGTFTCNFYKEELKFTVDGWKFFVTPMMGIERWRQVHNDYIQLLYEYGLVGFGIIMALMGMTAWKFVKTRKGLIPFASMAVFAMIAFWGFPVHTAIGIIPFIGLILFEKSLDEE